MLNCIGHTYASTSRRSKKWCDIISVMEPGGDGRDNLKIRVGGAPTKLKKSWLAIYQRVNFERLHTC